jgi:hypothetical protein
LAIAAEGYAEDRVAFESVSRVPMSHSFDLVLSKSLTPDEVVTTLAELVPAGLRVDVGREMSDLPDQAGAIRALVEDTDDPDWACVLNFLVCADECGLGPYPDLRIADCLFRRLGINALCSIYDFAGELDPYDPYWSLACIGGDWFLASTSGTALMGPYTDGVQSFAGDDKVRLVRPIEIPAKIFA